MSRLDRSQPPPPGPTPRDYRFPDFTYEKLGDHLEVYAVPWGTSPLVSLELVLPGGGEQTPLDSPGLASFTAALLDEGSHQNTGVEIARRMEGLGGSLSSGSDWNCASVSAICLAKDTETALNLLNDVALRPSFPEDAIERESHRRLAEIRRRQTQPGHLADRALVSAVYRGTVYEQPLIGTSEALKTYDRDRVLGFYRDQMQGSVTVIAVGRLDPDTLIEEIRSRTTVAPLREAPEPPSIQPVPPPEAPRILVVDRPAGSQTELRMGHVGVPRRYPQRPVLAVMESLLGGKFTSRINLNLRERHGYTYGARTSFSARRGPGPFVVSAAVETPSAGAAAREVIGELQRIRDTAVEPSELEDTIGYLLGVFPYTLQRSTGVAGRLGQLAVHDLPHDHYRRLPERLRAVTVEDIQAVAQKTLAPEALTIVAVGPANVLCQQFDGLGSVEIIEG